MRPLGFNPRLISPTIYYQKHAMMEQLEKNIDNNYNDKNSNNND